MAHQLHRYKDEEIIIHGESINPIKIKISNIYNDMVTLSIDAENGIKIDNSENIKEYHASIKDYNHIERSFVETKFYLNNKKELREAMLELSKRNHTYLEAARLLKITIHSVRKYSHKYNISFRKGKKGWIDINNINKKKLGLI